MPQRNTPLSLEEIENIRLLSSEKLSITDIAKTLKLGIVTVIKYFRLLNVPLPGHALRGPEKINDKQWRCKGCSQIRSIDDFLWEDSIKKEIKQSKCKFCIYAKTNIRLGNLESFLKLKTSSLKYWANKFKLPFNLSWIYLGELLEQQNQKCFYTDVNLVWGRGLSQTDARHRATVDKIIPENGYTVGNIVWCSRRANFIKSDLTLNEMELWMPNWFNRLQEFQKECKNDNITKPT